MEWTSRLRYTIPRRKAFQMLKDVEGRKDQEKERGRQKALQA